MRLSRLCADPPHTRVELPNHDPGRLQRDHRRPDPDRAWQGWSEAALRDASDRDQIAINPIIYAEITSGFATIGELDRHLGADVFRRLPLPYEAGFVAGRAFVEYRRRGGTRTSPLPDFYIGAHAAVSGLELLTRDARRFGGYSPRVQLISPT